ncbi:MAG: diacylglycerol kinase family protein, partial [Planctomycetota bacterium]
MNANDRQERGKSNMNGCDLETDMSLEKYMSDQFSISGRIQSFRHAIDGIVLMLRSQHNAWLHAIASVTVLLAGAFCRLGPREFCWLVIAIMAVWTAEALNTALEFLADVASPEFHPLAKKAKDVAAGAVLISAVGSAVIALLIFGPYILTYLHLME